MRAGLGLRLASIVTERSPIIDEAVAVLRRGGLVAFPTETVYGLGADAGNSAALARLFAVKGRPSSHPVIVHLGAASWIEQWASEVTPEAARLAARFWPGPLTLVVRRASRVLDAVTGGQDTVGLRVPAHPVARALLAAFGSGIAAPSANRFGCVSPTTAEHVRADLRDDVDLVIDGGACDVGIESTIVDVSRGAPVLLRPGHITAEQIADAAQRTVAGLEGQAPRAPGTLPAHYAPRTPMTLAPAEEVAARVRAAAGRAAVLAFEGTPVGAPAVAVRIVARNTSMYAHELYAALRELDASGASIIIVEEPPAGSEWVAVRDRLQRAAASTP
jgi:L-threonylcarbamoyladenylate synthase